MLHFYIFHNLVQPKSPLNYKFGFYKYWSNRSNFHGIYTDKKRWFMKPIKGLNKVAELSLSFDYIYDMSYFFHFLHQSRSWKKSKFLKFSSSTKTLAIKSYCIALKYCIGTDKDFDKSIHHHQIHLL